jgi:hypothetical protein
MLSFAREHGEPCGLCPARWIHALVATQFLVRSNFCFGASSIANWSASDFDSDDMGANEVAPAGIAVVIVS